MTGRLPEPSLTRDELDQRFQMYVDRRPKSAAQRFSGPLPRDWAVVPQSHRRPRSRAPLVTALSAGSSDETAGVTFHWARLDREVAAADFLSIWLTRLGFEVIASRRVPTPLAGDELEALTRIETESGTMLTRWRTLKHADHECGFVLIVEARALADHYRDHEQTLATIVYGADLLERSPWVFAEKLRTYRRARPGDFAIMYPVSWQLKEVRAEDSTDGVLLTEILHAVDDVPFGRITVMCTGNDLSAEGLRDIYLRGLASYAVIGEMKPLVERPAFGDLERSWETLGWGHARVDPKGALAPLDALAADPMADPWVHPERGYEIRVAIGRRERTWYLVALMGVSPFIEPMAAAINARAHDIVIQQMRTARAR